MNISSIRHMAFTNTSITWQDFSSDPKPIDETLHGWHNGNISANCSCRELPTFLIPKSGKLFQINFNYLVYLQQSMYCKVWTFIALWYVKMHVSRSLETIASHKIICKASIFPGRFKSIEFNSIIYSKDTTKNLYRGKWDQYFISLMLFDEAFFIFFVNVIFF